MAPNDIATRMWDFSKRCLAHRYLPAAPAVAAVLVMLPALKLGLAADDLIQRAVALRPNQLPPGIHETGIPLDSGSLPTTLRDFFFHRDPECRVLMKRYGVVPWWTPDDMRMGLWRPVSAFTHWLDYRLFPDSPGLMHAENIAWFAAVVFLVTVTYRKLMGPGWAAGLAAVLFLLDGNTYFPVAFVANRGFFVSLFCGLMCLYEHHQWRSAGRVWAPVPSGAMPERRLAVGLACPESGVGTAVEDPPTKADCKSALRWSGCVPSALFLALALFANEGGASTLAFILAYALVLEPGSLRRRALTVLPSILVIVLWRTVYTVSGFGIFHLGIYLDPAKEPLQFAREVLPRALVLLAGQLTHVAPELLCVVSPSLQPTVTALCGVLVVAALLVFLPRVRRDKVAGFWLAVMVLAAIPAATVLPVGKNLGFVAIGAYGLIGSFVAGVLAGPRTSATGSADILVASGQAQEAGKNAGAPGRACRILAWTACVLLLLAHIPGAIVGRVIAVQAVAGIFEAMNYHSSLADVPEPEGKHVIVVNAPCAFLLAYIPSYQAYHHLPLPRSARTLVPGCTGFEVKRSDDKTLVLQSKTRDIFSCDDVGPFHHAYAGWTCNRLMPAPRCKTGDRFELGCLTVDVLESGASGLPCRVAFRFDTSLDSPQFAWLRFDWQKWSYQPFKIPAIGQCVTLPGPLPLGRPHHREKGPRAGSRQT